MMAESAAAFGDHERKIMGTTKTSALKSLGPLTKVSDCLPLGFLMTEKNESPGLLKLLFSQGFCCL